MCTGIRLIAKNGSVVYARTLEFGQPIQSSIVFIPRNVPFTGTTMRKDVKGLQWKTRYAVVGANAAGEMGIIDGVNERGLAGGLFYLPGYACYQNVADDELNISLAPWELMTWLLTTCASVEDVKKALPTMRVANVVFGSWGIIPPVHAIIHDESGQSLVIEYTEGVLHMYDNPLGVITNAPTFDWHITNLKNYGNLSSLNSVPRDLRGVSLDPFGQGSGMFGLPGDFTPPSRFVRAVAFSQTVTQLKDEDQARDTAFHILNLFDIPVGVVCSQQEGQIHCDYTQWTSAVDLRNKKYYFHTYGNRNVQMVDLMKQDLESNKPAVVMNMDGQ